MFGINFVIKSPDEIIPFGDDKKYLSWFGLTDGILYINAGNDVIYEYSQAALDLWKNEFKYNDYYLSRFFEDISEIFAYIAAPVPRFFYEKINDFPQTANKWNIIYSEKNDDEYYDFLDNKYEFLTGWYYSRMIDSAHLKGGPRIYFFRCGGKITIKWESDSELENGGNIWTSPCGIYELDYSEFVSEIKRAVNSFLGDMDEQIVRAAEHPPENVIIDKEKLVEENFHRKESFLQKLSFFDDIKNIPGDLYDIDPDWNRIALLYSEAIKETSEK